MSDFPGVFDPESADAAIIELYRIVRALETEGDGTINGGDLVDAVNDWLTRQGFNREAES